MLLWITYGHLPRARKKKQSSLSVEEMDDHDECEVDKGDEALHTCPRVMKTLSSRVISCQNQSRTLNAVI